MVGTAIEGISGNRVIELSDSPMTRSSSPSDFWGSRWNQLVHIVLKGAIYVPLRKNGFSKGVAALATFATSGLLHEYVLTMIALKGVMLEDHSAYTPKYGYHLAFFAWNGMVLMLEGLFHNHAFILALKSALPGPVITTMVLMTVLPIGHWFTGKKSWPTSVTYNTYRWHSNCGITSSADEYAQTGFYNDFAVGFPQVVWSPLRYEL